LRISLYLSFFFCLRVPLYLHSFPTRRSSDLNLFRKLMSDPVRLTQYSHGAGCGCKISPNVLDVILTGSGAQNLDPKLWVGNASRDDAAVYALDDERGVVSTTDFFMPIVDDPCDFG